MKQLLSTLAILSSFSALSQTKPYVSNDTLYYSDVMKLYKGQELQIGIGKQSNGNFITIFYPPASSTFDNIDDRITATEKSNYHIATIKRFYSRKENDTLKYYLIITGKGVNNYYCDIIKAIDIGEISLERVDFSNIQNELPKYPMSIEDTFYFNDTIKLYVGQDIKLGPGTMPNGSFKYITDSRNNWVAAANATNGQIVPLHNIGAKYSGHILHIKRVYQYGNKRRGYTNYLILGGGNIINYECDIVNAIKSGEVVIDGYVPESLRPIVIQQAATFSKADELKKLKELRDNGTLSETEYQSEKKKILDK